MLLRGLHPSFLGFRFRLCGEVLWESMAFGVVNKAGFSWFRSRMIKPVVE